MPKYELLKQVTYDSVIFGATKGVLDRLLGTLIKPVDMKDIVIYAVSDGVYHYWFKKGGNLSIFREQDMDEEVSNAIFNGIGMTIGNELLGRRGRIVDGLISVGASHAVNNLVDEIMPK